MKKYIYLLIILFTMNTCVFAQLSTNDTISAIENSIYGYDYKNEPETKRLDRLEKHLYGEKRTGSIQKRLSDIQNDTGFVVKEEKPQHLDIKGLPDAKTLTQNLKEDSSVDYPIVDRMEEEIFHTTYKKENIYSRLNRLEEKVFNKTSSEDLNTRVYKLADVIAPAKNTQKQKDYSASDNYYANKNIQEVYNEQTLPIQLSALEEELLSSSYGNDNNSKRLSRLEQKMFNRTFVNDTDNVRIQRIAAAYEAKKNSYRYENNRKMQNMATMSQIGGILLMILAILL